MQAEIPQPPVLHGNTPSQKPAAVAAAFAEWPTVLLLTITGAVWGIAMLLPVGWHWLSFLLLVLALTQHSSLSHEILHGHPFRSERAGTLLGLFQPGLFVPYLRFKALHLAHHRNERLTDPYDDPESNYLDPAVWNSLPDWKKKLLRFNNTLLGRMVLGPMLSSYVFYRDDLVRIRAGDRVVLAHWLLHLPGVALTLWLVSLSAVPVWLYLLACYGALSLLRIRTFLEHRAHERASGRSVVIEDRGLLALLFLNNNYHLVHHMHPKVAWYRLPALYRSRRSTYLQRNQGYVYRSYSDVFRRYLLKGKDPVAHPLWRRD